MAAKLLEHSFGASIEKVTLPALQKNLANIFSDLPGDLALRNRRDSW